jgi:hypothetical protein
MIVFVCTHNPYIHPDVIEYDNVYNISVSQGNTGTAITIKYNENKETFFNIPSNDLQGISIYKDEVKPMLQNIEMSK